VILYFFSRFCSSFSLVVDCCHWFHSIRAVVDSFCNAERSVDASFYRIGLALRTICRQTSSRTGWSTPRADWAAWLPGTLSCGSVVPPSRWAATSNVEICQMVYPVNRGRIFRMEGREGCEGQSRKEEEMGGGSGTGEGPMNPKLRREGSVWIFVQEFPSS